MKFRSSKGLVIAAISAFASAIAASPTLAADLPVKAYKAPPPAAAVLTWTGFYVGLNGGGGSAQFKRSGVYDTNPVDDSQSQTGYFVGGQIGYNWQFDPNWVAGVEADFQGSNFHNTFNCGAGPTNLVGSCYDSSSRAGYDLNYFGTVRARLGYAMMSNWLPYITGGFAWGNVRYTADDYLPNNSATGSATSTGWTAGAGVEYAITQHWSVKAEYLYVALGGTSINPISPTFGSYGVSVKTNANLGRFGVNYRF